MGWRSWRPSSSRTIISPFVGPPVCVCGRTLALRHPPKLQPRLPDRREAPRHLPLFSLLPRCRRGWTACAPSPDCVPTGLRCVCACAQTYNPFGWRAADEISCTVHFRAVRTPFTRASRQPVPSSARVGAGGRRRSIAITCACKVSGWMGAAIRWFYDRDRPIALQHGVRISAHGKGAVGHFSWTALWNALVMALLSFTAARGCISLHSTVVNRFLTLCNAVHCSAVPCRAVWFLLRSVFVSVSTGLICRAVWTFQCTAEKVIDLTWYYCYRCASGSVCHVLGRVVAALRAVLIMRCKTVPLTVVSTA
eukprot:SAG11_NODE_4234_length_1996_cov_3.429117_2_plen_308_part_00